jgi:hypothetical protein
MPSRPGALPAATSSSSCTSTAPFASVAPPFTATSVIGTWVL